MIRYSLCRSERVGWMYMLPPDPYVDYWIREFLGQIISSERKKGKKEKALITFLKMDKQYVRVSELAEKLSYKDPSSFKNSTQFDDLEPFFIYIKIPIRGHGHLYVKTEIAKVLREAISFIIDEYKINICKFINSIMSNEELYRKIGTIGRLMQKYRDSRIICLGLMLDDCTNIYHDIDINEAEINFECNRFYENRYTGCEITIELKNVTVTNFKLFINKLDIFITNFVKDIFLNDEVYLNIFRKHYKDRLRELEEQEFEKMIRKKLEETIISHVRPQIREQLRNQFKDDLEEVIRFNIVVKPWIPNFLKVGGD